MPHTTFTVGRLQCHALEGGTQRLDGGAMFGVVPKPLWERRIVPDERNRIPLTLLDGEAEVLPGLCCVPTPGHVPYHQSILVESGGERACFLADVVPTSAHLPLPWIMAYDLEPLVTLESKRRLYARAELEGWLLMFEHDPAMVAGRLGRDGKAFALVDPLRAG